MQRILDFLRLDDLPQMTRPNYVAELQQILLWGMVVGAVGGYMASVVASKTFDASPLLTTIIWALPMLMNVLNVGWSTLLRGRPRKPAFLWIVACGVVGVGSVGLNSSDWKPWGGWVFAGQIAFTHLFISGLVTLRTTIWKVNYPATHRACITGRLQTVHMLLALLTTLALSLLYDREPGCYRLVYPAVALIGACSLLPLRRMRMRGERAEIRRFQEHVAQRPAVDGETGTGLWAGIKEAGVILRTDTLFTKYMVTQFLLGSANFFTEPILVNALTKDLRLHYITALTLLLVIPQIVLLGSIRFWAPLFDRVGVLRFRIYNSGCWSLSHVGVCAAMLILAFGGESAVLAALAVLIIGRILNGLARGGGVIAWNIGHLQFAREHQTELYMGIHVGLTGLRGLLMPLLGLGARQLFGYPALLIALGLAFTAHLLFRRLAAEQSRDTHAE